MNNLIHTSITSSQDSLADDIAQWIEKLRHTHSSRLNDLFTLQRWLSIPAVTDRIKFPCSIHLSEKPDFVIKSEDVSIGIECTWFLAEQRARAARIANHKKTWHTPTLFDFDSPKRRNSEISDMVQAGRTGWRSASEMLVIYEEKLGKILSSKTCKAIIESTENHSIYWLVIEDHHFMSSFDLSNLDQVFRSRLAAYWTTRPCFDMIFLVSLTNPCTTHVFDRKSQ
jgi:hypothetical protein